MITIIDYGMGNLRSVSKALEHLGAAVRVTNDPREVEQAEKLILPGVGAFGAAMQELQHRQLIESLRRCIIENRTPYLGICLGLQLLFESSTEGCQAGQTIAGFGILEGQVEQFPINLCKYPSVQPQGPPFLKIPHMGWNQVVATQNPMDERIASGCPLLKDISNGSYFYFVHSYRVASRDPRVRQITVLESDYGYGVDEGEWFSAMVWRDNIFATQFHPEKSQALGLKLLKNFIDL